MRIDGPVPSKTPSIRNIPASQEASKTGKTFASAFHEALGVPAIPQSGPESASNSLPPEPLFTAPAPYFQIPATRAPAQTEAVVPANLVGKVVGVKGGNSLEILAEGKVMEIRIQGVDCPEKAYAAGKAARHFVVDQAFMNDVQVEISGTKSDGTLVGKVKLANGKSLGEELIKKGLAWWDKSAAPEENGLAQLETQAREAFLGIWAGTPEDEEQNDWGREVLVKREQSVQSEGALFTKVDP